MQRPTPAFFVTRDLDIWPFDVKINEFSWLVESSWNISLSSLVTLAGPSCIGFLRYRTGKQINGGKKIISSVWYQQLAVITSRSNARWLRHSYKTVNITLAGLHIGRYSTPLPAKSCQNHTGYDTQELIRRWDSERQLFNDDIAHT